MIGSGGRCCVCVLRYRSHEVFFFWVWQSTIQTHTRIPTTRGDSMPAKIAPLCLSAVRNKKNKKKAVKRGKRTAKLITPKTARVSAHSACPSLLVCKRSRRLHASRSRSRGSVRFFLGQLVCTIFAQGSTRSRNEAEGRMAGGEGCGQFTFQVCGAKNKHKQSTNKTKRM